MKAPGDVLQGLIETTLMRREQRGPTTSQQAAFIRSLRNVKWKDVFQITDSEYASDRKAKANDPIMKHYIR